HLDLHSFPTRRSSDLVAEVGRRAVPLAGEHVAEVAVAVRAQDLGAAHAPGAVGPLDDPLTGERGEEAGPAAVRVELVLAAEQFGDRKSTRLNSSHVSI